LVFFSTRFRFPEQLIELQLEPRQHIAAIETIMVLEYRRQSRGGVNLNGASGGVHVPDQVYTGLKMVF